MEDDGNAILIGADHLSVGGYILNYAGTDGALRWQLFDANVENNAIAIDAENRMAVTGTPLTRLFAEENVPPAAAAIQAQVTVNEGQTAMNSGTFSDSNDNETVTLTATRNELPFGVVTKDDAAGTWNWSCPTTDGPEDGGIVIITADDEVADPVTTTFALAVNNVAPVFEAGPNVMLSLAEARLLQPAARLH